MLLHANINQNSFQFPSERITLDRHNLKNFTTTNFKLKLYSGKKKYFFTINQFNKFCVKLLVTAKNFGIHILSFTLLPLITQIWCSLFKKFQWIYINYKYKLNFSFINLTPVCFLAVWTRELSTFLEPVQLNQFGFSVSVSKFIY